MLENMIHASSITPLNAANLQTISILKGHEDSVKCVAWSPDGQYLATASKDNLSMVWKISHEILQSQAAALAGKADCIAMSLQPVKQFKSTDNNPVIAWSPDSKTLAFAGDTYGDIKLWHTDREQAGSNHLDTLKGHTSAITSLSWSPDGALLASGSWDRAVRVWDVRKRVSVSILRGHLRWVTGVAFSPDGSLLASAGDVQKIQLWDLASESPIARLDLDASYGDNSVAWSGDGRLLASIGRDGVARVWDAESCKLIASLPCKTNVETPAGLAFSPDGRLLAAPCGDAVRVWDTASLSAVADLEGHYAPVSWAAFSPDGSMLASASDDGTARVWGAPGGGEGSGRSS